MLDARGFLNAERLRLGVLLFLQSTRILNFGIVTVPITKSI